MAWIGDKQQRQVEVLLTFMHVAAGNIIVTVAVRVMTLKLLAGSRNLFMLL
jgi:hypothetical protein